MKYERLKTIAEKLITYMNERLCDNTGEELYKILSEEIKMTDNEIDELSKNFPLYDFDSEDEEENNDDRYELEYCARYGYSIIPSETIQGKLEKMFKEENEKYESLETEILSKFSNISYDFSFHSDVIELGFVETLDSLDISDGKAKFPEEIVNIANEIFDIIEVFLNENSEHFICPKCGHYVYTDVCKTEKFWKEDNKGVENHLMNYKCTSCESWISEDEI